MTSVRAFAPLSANSSTASTISIESRRALQPSHRSLVHRDTPQVILYNSTATSVWPAVVPIKAIKATAVRLLASPQPLYPRIPAKIPPRDRWTTRTLADQQPQQSCATRLMSQEHPGSVSGCTLGWDLSLAAVMEDETKGAVEKLVGLYPASRPMGVDGTARSVVCSMHGGKISVSVVWHVRLRHLRRHERSGL